MVVRNILGLAVAVSFCSAAALAAPPPAPQYDTVLRGSNETTPNASTAVGYATVLLSGNTIDFVIKFNGLTTNLAAGHVHCCALQGANAGVAIDFAPVGFGKSGTLTRSFDLTNAATYTNGFRNGAGGGSAAGAQAAFLAGLNSGKAYINLHNSAFPGGEIRGNLGAVPEPASWAMMIAGFGLVGTSLRRRRAAMA
ncbi:CHRD domain-containing protein [Sandarakinorhabdus sp.]|uniref:CHRD domain-containing protein n=1 Tax=Sandarakinorhabdus sp. TaxID=1916663 RepID=UPI003340A54D